MTLKSKSQLVLIVTSLDINTYADDTIVENGYVLIVTSLDINGGDEARRLDTDVLIVTSLDIN